MTPDITLSFKADGVGIDVVDPPGPTLAEEPDAAELENRALKKTIRELQLRVDPQPDLALEFLNGAGHLIAKLSGLEMPTDEDVDEELRGERAALELRDKFSPTFLYRAPSEKTVNAYIQRLREWLVEYRKVAVMKAHTIDVQLVLANRGIGNATDIEIDLTFPEVVSVAEERRLPEVKKRPSAPEPEEVGIAAVMRATAIPTIVPFGGRNLALAGRFSLREPVRLSADAKNKHHIRVHVDTAKHQTNIKLPKFEAWFAKDEIPSGFKIAYRIHAASSPDIRTGDLNVRVDVTEGPASLLHGLVEPPDDVDVPEIDEVPESEGDE